MFLEAFGELTGDVVTFSGGSVVLDSLRSSVVGLRTFLEASGELEDDLDALPDPPVLDALCSCAGDLNILLDSFTSSVENLRTFVEASGELVADLDAFPDSPVVLDSLSLSLVGLDAASDGSGGPDED